MAPMSVNKPHLRVFKFPTSAIATFALVLSLYYVSHGTPGAFSIGGVSVPFGGLARTLSAIFFYTVEITHVYEAYLAYSLASEHRASTVNKFLYTIFTFVCGFPLLFEIRRQIKLTRVGTIAGKRTK
ncbi:hypothetical protein BS47DRAFT_1349479 [Hydnum rufescens UP504]|uniref:Uncharacterized protein n=1 Tax=Hydnum rufescens UP504 TaxID=1448309 RepID=A0A9P6AQU4_9AGAM|nr:hypothetical protein BS47DRAFT_1349479 [Hydnum rufescens UP504]